MNRTRLIQLGFGFIVILPITGFAAPSVTPLPKQDVFLPLIADPKEPRFHMSLLSVDSEANDSTVAAVGFGENFGIARWPGDTPNEGWQLNFSAAVFSQFNLDAPSDELINADYLVGFPLSYRDGDWSMRLRFYHQSSHLGDEYVLRVHPDRINLSYESVEFIGSYEWNGIRVYGGGEYLAFREPEELEPKIAHAGVEYRAEKPFWKISTLGAAWPIVGLDIRAWEQHDWEAAKSLKLGLEFRPQHDVERSGRYWNLNLELYDGPSPYGQFYMHEVSYYGISMVLHL